MSYFADRPATTEYAPYYAHYVSLIPQGHDPLQQLREQPITLRHLLAGVTDEQALLRYAPGKWSLKEMLVHVTDTERIFAYRALRIARGDQQPLPGFEQDDYVPASGADARTLEDILHEQNTVRAATLSLLASFSAEAIGRFGTASGQPVSVRAMAYLLAGHEAHHLNIVQERYLPAVR